MTPTDAKPTPVAGSAVEEVRPTLLTLQNAIDGRSPLDRFQLATIHQLLGELVARLDEAHKLEFYWLDQYKNLSDEKLRPLADQIVHWKANHDHQVELKRKAEERAEELQRRLDSLEKK